MDASSRPSRNSSYYFFSQKVQAERFSISTADDETRDATPIFRRGRRRKSNNLSRSTSRNHSNSIRSESRPPSSKRSESRRRSSSRKRPSKTDCKFLVRNEKCPFGEKCRYNHVDVQKDDLAFRRQNESLFAHHLENQNPVMVLTANHMKSKRKNSEVMMNDFDNEPSTAASHRKWSTQKRNSRKNDHQQKNNHRKNKSKAGRFQGIGGAKSDSTNSIVREVFEMKRSSVLPENSSRSPADASPEVKFQNESQPDYASALLRSTKQVSFCTSSGTNTLNPSETSDPSHSAGHHSGDDQSNNSSVASPSATMPHANALPTPAAKERTKQKRDGTIHPNDVARFHSAEAEHSYHDIEVSVLSSSKTGKELQRLGSIPAPIPDESRDQRRKRDSLTAPPAPSGASTASPSTHRTQGSTSTSPDLAAGRPVGSAFTSPTQSAKGSR